MGGGYSSICLFFVVGDYLPIGADEVAVLSAGVARYLFVTKNTRIVKEQWLILMPFSQNRP